MFNKKDKSEYIDNIENTSSEKTEKKAVLNVKGNKILRKNEIKKQLKYGSLSVVFTVVVVAVIIAVNVLVGALSDKFEMGVDTTDEQYSVLSDASVKYLSELEGYDIELTFIGDRQELLSDTYYNKIVHLAESYVKTAPNLTLTYIDPDKTPGFESQFGNASFTVGDAVVKCGDRFRQLTSADFLSEKSDETSTDSNSTDTTAKEYELSAEYALTTAIMVVTASDNPAATVINGHGEKTLEKLEKLLVNNGFEVQTQSIVKELDYDSDLIIIAAPTKDYSEDDLKKLDDFLYNNGKYGKNVMYIADYAQPKLPNLEAFLYDWGIVLSEGVVYESDDSLAYANMPYLNTLEFIDPNLTLSTALTEATAYGFWGRPAKIANVLDVNMVNSVVLQHTESSKVGTVVNGNFNKGSGEAYPYVAMSYTSIQKNDEDMNLLESSLIFVNSTAFFEDQIFEKTYSANPDITISVVDSTLGRENTVYIPTKTLSATALGITLLTGNVIGAIAAVGIPLIILAVCLVVTIRRRFL